MADWISSRTLTPSINIDTLWLKEMRHACQFSLEQELLIIADAAMLPLANGIIFFPEMELGSSSRLWRGGIKAIPDPDFDGGLFILYSCLTKLSFLLLFFLFLSLLMPYHLETGTTKVFKIYSVYFEANDIRNPYPRVDQPTATRDHKCLETLRNLRLAPS